MNKRDSIFLSIDWLTVILYLILVISGLLTIYSSTWVDSSTGLFDPGSYSRKQAVYLAISLSIAFFILLLDASIFQRLSYFFYFIGCVLLVVVLVVGDEVSGAKSWINLGGFSIQPAEFAKVATALAVSKFIGDKGYYGLNIYKKCLLFSFILIPIALILLEPDAGSAIVFLSFIIPLFREGFSAGITILLLSLVIVGVLSLVVNNFILLGVVFVILLICFLLLRSYKGIITYIVLFFILSAVSIFSVKFAFDNFLKPHQQERIEILLGQMEDNKGAGYNINQSKIAIGSGAFFGKGYLDGTQTKLNFVPEQHTDFIFCTVGEEFGFFGSFLLVLLYFVLLVKIITMAERQRTRFSRVYGYCVAGIFFFHVAINICMTIGLMPVIGIPLPFFSYGGSSLLAFTIMLFIFIKLDAYRLSILQ